MELPTVMQNIGMALLTAFIPIALFLFSQMHENSDKEYSILDKAVLLDYVVRMKSLIWQCSLIFLPLLFWDIDFFWLRVIICIVWAIGVFSVGRNLLKPYAWIRKDRLEFRLRYLKESKLTDESPKLWKSVWDSSGKDMQNDEKFFKIFLYLIKELYLDEENIGNLNLFAKLLNDFQIFVKKRSFIFLTAKDDVFEKILEWHFMIWQREFKYMIRKDKLDQFSGYINISSILDATIKSVTERALQNEMAHGFFKLIDTHVEKNKNESVINAPKQVYYYLDSILGVFYKSFFENIEKARDRYDIWHHYFPKNWLITKQNLTNPDNAPVRVTINHFMMMARDRIKLSKKGEVEIDMTLEIISKELFPTVEPSFWAIMFTLLMRPWGDNDRIKTLIEYPRNFGYGGRVYVSWYEGHEDQIEKNLLANREEEIKTSIELLLTLFPHEFTEEKTKSYYIELIGLNYETGSKEQLYKEQVLFYMKKILEVVEAKPKK